MLLFLKSMHVNYICFSSGFDTQGIQHYWIQNIVLEGSRGGDGAGGVGGAGD